MMVREYSAAKRLRDPCWGRLQANKKLEAGLVANYPAETENESEGWANGLTVVL